MEVSVFEQAPRSKRIERRQAMQAPQDVEAMLKLASLGWGTQRIADELGCSRNTVKRYVRQGGWQPYESPARAGRLSGHGEWLAAQFRQHRGNCNVVRQELSRVHGIELQVIKLAEAKKGFVLLPKRWVVERSFAWAARFRRLAKDYERLPDVLRGLHFLVFAILMLPKAIPLLTATGMHNTL